MSAKKNLVLTDQQYEALRLVLDSIEHAMRSGVGATALAYGIEHENVGLVGLMHRLSEHMYHEPTGYLRQRHIAYDAEKRATGLGMTFDEYLDFAQEDGAKDYKL